MPVHSRPLRKRRSYVITDAELDLMSANEQIQSWNRSFDKAKTESQRKKAEKALEHWDKKAIEAQKRIISELD
jgi:hypothetical protein